jgi:uncharacterized membrane protein YdjX (TVP38/TMEM64 family)
MLGWKLLAPLAMAAAAIAFAPLMGAAMASASPPQEELELARDPIYAWMLEHRSAAYWVAPLLMVVVAILPIPAEIPATMNGIMFGTVIGILMTWGGAVVGAQISYELARCFGRKLSQRFVKPEALARLEKLQHAEVPVLLMLRLTPIVAFTAVNWASGLLQVRRRTFMWTTAVGILPGAIAFTASGSLIGALYGSYPGAVTVVVAAICGAFLIRAWWKFRHPREEMRP